MLTLCFYCTWKLSHLSEQVPLISVWLNSAEGRYVSCAQFDLTGKVTGQMISYLAGTLESS